MPEKLETEFLEARHLGHERTADVAWAYDEKAEGYDRFYGGPVHQAENRVVAEWLKGCAGSVLDVGCGTGLTVELAEVGPERYFGLDISPGMLNVAKGKFPNHKFTIGDMCELLDIENEGFDNVVSLWAFQYALRPWDAVQEAWRVLKPGGSLWMVVNAPAHLKRGEGYLHSDVALPQIKYSASTLRSMFLVEQWVDLDIQGFNAKCDGRDYLSVEGLYQLMLAEREWVGLDDFMYLLVRAIKEGS